MNYENFRELVRKMRHAQRQYFRTRSQDWIKESKRLEKLVDQELKKDTEPELDL